MCHEKFIVTSNYTPEELWPNDPVLATAVKRRFKMIYIGWTIIYILKKTIMKNIYDVLGNLASVSDYIT